MAKEPKWLRDLKASQQKLAKELNVGKLESKPTKRQPVKGVAETSPKVKGVTETSPKAFEAFKEYQTMYPNRRPTVIPSPKYHGQMMIVPLDMVEEIEEKGWYHFPSY